MDDQRRYCLEALDSVLHRAYRQSAPPAVHTLTMARYPNEAVDTCEPTQRI